MTRLRRIFGKAIQSILSSKFILLSVLSLYVDYMTQLLESISSEIFSKQSICSYLHLVLIINKGLPWIH